MALGTTTSEATGTALRFTSIFYGVSFAFPFDLLLLANQLLKRWLTRSARSLSATCNRCLSVAWVSSLCESENVNQSIRRRSSRIDWFTFSDSHRLLTHATDKHLLQVAERERAERVSHRFNS